MRKRSIAFIVCLAMIVSLFAAMPMPVNAEAATTGVTGTIEAGTSVYADADDSADKYQTLLAYTVTVEQKVIKNGTVWYKYSCDKTISGVFKDKYPYVKAADITIADDSEVPATTLVTGTVGGAEVSITGDIPADVSLSLDAVGNDSIDLDKYDIDSVEDILTAVDMKLVKENGTEWQPDEPVTVSIDAEALGLEDGDVVTIKHNHDGVVKTLGEYTVENGTVTFETDGFSIYVVTINSNDWNRNNYAIMMSVGDTLRVRVTQNNNSNWSSSDSLILNVTSTREQETTITGIQPGTVTLSKGNQSIQVTVVEQAGDSISDDIIFENVTASYTSDNSTSITEYGNTYGPYVMKIRFEDTEGKLLDMGQEYYVFDSEVPINIATFAADAPAGYTYDGSYFYWSGHYTGTKSYVSEVTRLSTLGSYGSYLYFDYIVAGESTVHEDTHYQPSGVLHIVYRSSDEAYNVIFKDHEGTTLHSYAPEKADRGYATIPAAYVATLDTTLENSLEANHEALSNGYEFTGNWVVSGGGSGIDGTYTTDQLKSSIPDWHITSDITIKAQCIEATAALTITKTLPENNLLDENQTFVFTVTGTEGEANEDINMAVVIKGEGSITLKDMPLGNYTVTEDTEWSWRYTPDHAEQTVIVYPQTGGNIVFNNVLDDNKWLDGSGYAENKFEKIK